MVTAPQSGEALQEVPLRIVVLSDDDRRHPARATLAALEEAVAFAKRAFASGRIRFRRMEARLDGVVAGDVLVPYAPRVMPSGPLPLPVDVPATAGRQLSFRVVGRNPRSRGWHFGLDAVTLDSGGTHGFRGCARWRVRAADQPAAVDGAPDPRTPARATAPSG